MVGIVQEMRCPVPECQAATNVVTVGAADYPRCPNGHNLVWSQAKGLRVLEDPEEQFHKNHENQTTGEPPDDVRG